MNFSVRNHPSVVCCQLFCLLGKHSHCSLSVSYSFLSRFHRKIIYRKVIYGFLFSWLMISVYPWNSLFSYARLYTKFYHVVAESWLAAWFVYFFKMDRFWFIGRISTLLIGILLLVVSFISSVLQWFIGVWII